MSKNTSPTRKPKSNRAMLIGYVLFGITALACASWIVYQYYLINGWERIYTLSSSRFSYITSNHLPVSLIPVSLAGGIVGSSKANRRASLLLCYAYLLLVLLIIPMCWSAEPYSISRILEVTLCFCSWYSIFIIPFFSVSCFLTWSIKKLLTNKKQPVNEGEI